MLHEFHSSPGAMKIHRFFNQKRHFDDLYNRFIVQKVLAAGHHITFRLFDAGRIAFLGPYGISRTITNVSRKTSQLQSGYVYHYAFVVLVAVTALFFVLAMAAQTASGGLETMAAPIGLECGCATGVSPAGDMNGDKHAEEYPNALHLTLVPTFHHSASCAPCA